MAFGNEKRKRRRGLFSDLFTCFIRDTIFRLLVLLAVLIASLVFFPESKVESSRDWLNFVVPPRR